MKPGFKLHDVVFNLLFRHRGKQSLLSKNEIRAINSLFDLDILILSKNLDLLSPQSLPLLDFLSLYAQQDSRFLKPSWFRIAFSRASVATCLDLP